MFESFSLPLSLLLLLLDCPLYFLCTTVLALSYSHRAANNRKVSINPIDKDLSYKSIDEPPPYWEGTDEDPSMQCNSNSTFESTQFHCEPAPYSFTTEEHTRKQPTPFGSTNKRYDKSNPPPYAAAALAFGTSRFVGHRPSPFRHPSPVITTTHLPTPHHPGPLQPPAGHSLSRLLPLDLVEHSRRSIQWPLRKQTSATPCPAFRLSIRWNTRSSHSRNLRRPARS